jgi:hypothetical protein
MVAHAGDGDVATLAKHAHGAWRRRARRQRSGLVAATAGGAAGSVPHTEDSSSRETEVPRGWGRRGGWRQQRGMEAAAQGIGTVGWLHDAVKP